jgi:hypothetical protein
MAREIESAENQESLVLFFGNERTFSPAAFILPRER